MTYKLAPSEPSDIMIGKAREIMNKHGYQNREMFDELYKAMLASCQDVDSEPVMPDFFQLDNGSEYWFECPDDASILSDLDNAEVGAEYEVFASHTYRQTYRVTKVPDEISDDTEVELVESDRNYYTTPQPDRVAELEAKLAKSEADNVRLVEALNRLDGWLEVRHLGGLMPDEKALLAEMEAK